MALPVEYRNRMLAQFIESYVTFIHKKRKVAELLAKGDLTAEEANILSHFQRDVDHDRGVFALWRDMLRNQGGYNLNQIKTFILNNRATVLNFLMGKEDEELSLIEILRAREIADAITPEQLANLPILLAELDNRKAKRTAWKILIQELRDKTDTDFATEAEM